MRCALQAAGGLALRVASRLPRYSDMYSLVLSSTDQHSISLKRLWSRPRKCAPHLAWLAVFAFSTGPTAGSCSGGQGTAEQGG